MKNLSTIPRLPLFADFTILITVVVCLAAFTEAEKTIPNAQQTAKMKGEDTLQRGNVANYYKNLQKETATGKVQKRYSEDFGESDEFDSDRENDGYGYDEDEYYHLNNKRNDEVSESLEEDKTNADEEKKKSFESQKMVANANPKDTTAKESGNKDAESYKANFAGEPAQTQCANIKSLTADKKIADAIDNLKMSDFKENTAVSEKGKERKSEASSTSHSKLTEGKKAAKAAESKEPAKLKDSKITDEKKDTQVNLKDDKGSVGGKNVKENVKNAEDKDKLEHEIKSVKLSDSAENMNKNKEGETVKISKDDKDSSRVVERGSMEPINANSISQINTRANLVSNDYKYNVGASKAEDDERVSEELNENGKNGLREYTEDVRERKQSEQEKNNYEYENNAQKGNEYYTLPISFEVRKEVPSEYYKKRESWKEQARAAQEQQQLQQQEQEQQQQRQQLYDFSRDSYHLNFPPGELENTEYHKNYIKSLRRYKGLDDAAKVLNPGAYTRNGYREFVPEGRKKKRSKVNKRKSCEVMPEMSEANLRHTNKRRNVYAVGDTFLREVPVLQTRFVNRRKADLDKAYAGANQDNTRQRRKSPEKLEYDIKIYNQKQEEAKTTPNHRRRKKDAQAKLAERSDDKYQKKPPYSQVPRDDLTKLTKPELRFRQTRNIYGEEKKFKRKAQWKRDEIPQETDLSLRGRGLPLGYYSNRVKFGQKHPITEESRNTLADAFESSVPSEDKNFFRSWDPKDYKHDPIKRYDDDTERKSNSLILVKKDKNGGHIAKTFFDSDAKGIIQGSIDPEQLAKLLSKDSGYVVLKRTDNDKFQEIGDSSMIPRLDFSSVEGPKTNAEVTVKNRDMFTRSYHAEEEDKKFQPVKAGGKSNFKKTFEKFRDLADFFRDNEQEVPESQQSSQETKQGGQIVFSEDKLPDPIIINNEMDIKGFRQKGQNAISSTSVNLKQSDQLPASKTQGEEPTKSMLTSEVKEMNPNLEAALRGAFPEAKTINSVLRNGNEIIVLDFNRNQIKNEKGGFTPIKNLVSKQQQGASSGRYAGGNLQVSGDRQVELVLHDKPYPAYQQPTIKQPPHAAEKSNKLNNLNSPSYAILTAPNEVSIPFNKLGEVLFKASEKKSGTLDDGYKTLSKKNVKWPPQKMSENLNQFLKDLHELSEINKEPSIQKLKVNQKREQAPIPSSFSELSGYSDANVKYLGSLLQNIMSGDNSDVAGNKETRFEVPNGMHAENEYQNSKTDTWYPSVAGFDTDTKRHGSWTSADRKKEYMPVDEEKFSVSDEVREDIDALLQGEGMRSVDENSQQDELFEELSAASDKIQRLRREGMDKAKLRKTIEDALMARERRQSEKSEKTNEAKAGEENKKNDEASVNESKRKSEKDAKVAAEDNTDGSQESQLKEQETKEGDKSLRKPEQESELTENANKNQKDKLSPPNAASRRKRGENNRRKRSTDRVSTSDTGSTILQKEVNYQSVYSAGPKRKLLQMPEKDEVDEESNIDPMILSIFRGDGQNRARRSLTTSGHSNYKREIDLDESMPNDFQNFLVTSLAGSQKREIVKKDEAMWEGKENSPDNFNQIVESTGVDKDISEDSALEKREVSNNREDTKEADDYGEGGNDSDGASTSGVMGGLTYSGKKTRSQVKATPLNSKTSTFGEEKVPTQIRIQITNASTKEKKSSKPVMEENESNANEMESPKEKEYYDKNKIGPLRMNKNQKIRQKMKYDYGQEDDGRSEGRNTYAVPQPKIQFRKKKKKYVQDVPMKPVKDFATYDQKAMDVIMRKYFLDQNMLEQTTQKLPVSNHLPQVETVYNPTQGTNKAQLDTYRQKGNPLNKNAATAKNMIDTPGMEDDVYRSYNPYKSKANVKEYDNGDWKPFAERMRPRQDEDPKHNNRALGRDAVTPNAHTRNSGKNNQKWNTPPYNTFFSRLPPNEIISNTYDVLKVKPEEPNWNKEPTNSKTWPKPLLGNENSKHDEKDKNTYPASTVTGDSNQNTLEYFLNMKPFVPKYKSKEAGKSQGDAKGKMGVPVVKYNKYVKNQGFKQPFLPNSHVLDESKDADYLEASDDEYEDAGKQDHVENSDMIKKTKAHEANRYRQYKMPEDDTFDDYYDGWDDEYDENNEDDYLDDYSLLANNNWPEMSRLAHRSGKPDEAFLTNDILRSHSVTYLPKGNSYGHVGFKNNGEKMLGGTTSFQDFKSQYDPFRGTQNILQKANQKSNIFGKNLMQNLNRYNYDKSLNEEIKLRDGKTPMKSVLEYPIGAGERLHKRKMDWQLKRAPERSRIGSRLFYAAKSEISDPKRLQSQEKLPQYRYNRNVYYRSQKRNPLNAELRGTENEFEYESEDNGRHFTGGILYGKYQKEEEENDGGTKKRNSGVDDVKKNLEDNESVPDDSVLENVIGKYIMRKSVKTPETNLAKAHDSAEKVRQGDGLLGEARTQKKRSADETKVRLKKRTLTEQNFKKYHHNKKNLKRKSHPADVEDGGIAGCDSSEGGRLMKRSTLDLLKKITTKEKDKKTVDALEVRNGGFEPIICATKYDTPGNDETLKSEKNNLRNYQTALNLGEKGSDKARKEGRSDGPWKIELNKKVPESLTNNGDAASIERNSEAVANEEAPMGKSYVVIAKNVRSAEGNTGEEKRLGTDEYRYQTASSDGTDHIERFEWKRSVNSPRQAQTGGGDIIQQHQNAQATVNDPSKQRADSEADAQTDLNEQKTEINPSGVNDMEQNLKSQTENVKKTEQKRCPGVGQNKEGIETKKITQNHSNLNKSVKESFEEIAEANSQNEQNAAKNPSKVASAEQNSNSFVSNEEGAKERQIYPIKQNKYPGSTDDDSNSFQAATKDVTNNFEKRSLSFLKEGTDTSTKNNVDAQNKENDAPESEKQTQVSQVKKNGDSSTGNFEKFTIKISLDSYKGGENDLTAQNTGNDPFKHDSFDSYINEPVLAENEDMSEKHVGLRCLGNHKAQGTENEEEIKKYVTEEKKMNLVRDSKLMDKEGTDSMKMHVRKRSLASIKDEGTESENIQESPKKSVRDTEKVAAKTPERLREQNRLKDLSEKNLPTSMSSSDENSHCGTEKIVRKRSLDSPEKQKEIEDGQSTDNLVNTENRGRSSSNEDSLDRNAYQHVPLYGTENFPWKTSLSSLINEEGEDDEIAENCARAQIRGNDISMEGTNAYELASQSGTENFGKYFWKRPAYPFETNSYVTNHRGVQTGANFFPQNNLFIKGESPRSNNYQFAPADRTGNFKKIAWRRSWDLSQDQSKRTDNEEMANNNGNILNRVIYPPVRQSYSEQSFDLGNEKLQKFVRKRSLSQELGREITENRVREQNKATPDSERGYVEQINGDGENFQKYIWKRSLDSPNKEGTIPEKAQSDAQNGEENDLFEDDWQPLRTDTTEKFSRKRSLDSEAYGKTEAREIRQKLFKTPNKAQDLSEGSSWEPITDSENFHTSTWKRNADLFQNKEEAKERERLKEQNRIEKLYEEDLKRMPLYGTENFEEYKGKRSLGSYAKEGAHPRHMTEENLFDGNDMEQIGDGENFGNFVWKRSLDASDEEATRQILENQLSAQNKPRYVFERGYVEQNPDFGVENFKKYKRSLDSTKDEKKETADVIQKPSNAQNKVRDVIKDKQITGTEKDVKHRSLESPKKAEKEIIAQNRATDHSEGDSPAQVPHLEQNVDSVSSEAQCKNSGDKQKFPSKARFVKRKPVFPPSNDANIIRDSRHINEETSEYLGHQVVEAILAHVSTNPRFKEMIAPGLSVKTTTKEDTEGRKATDHQNDFSQQVQNLLQKVMFDIEKLAERHVKKRMCSKIDNQSKQFLQSLLNIPLDDNQHKTCSVPKTCFVGHEADTSDGNPSQFIYHADRIKGKVCQNLRKRQNILLKLIDDYQHLTRLEKKTIDVSFQYLQNELSETNRALGSLEDKECQLRQVPIKNNLSGSKSEEMEVKCGILVPSTTENTESTTTQQPEIVLAENKTFSTTILPQLPETSTEQQTENILMCKLDVTKTEESTTALPTNSQEVTTELRLQTITELPTVFETPTGDLTEANPTTTELPLKFMPMLVSTDFTTEWTFKSTSEDVDKSEDAYIRIETVKSIPGMELPCAESIPDLDQTYNDTKMELEFPKVQPNDTFQRYDLLPNSYTVTTQPDYHVTFYKSLRFKQSLTKKDGNPEVATTPSYNFDFPHLYGNTYRPSELHKLGSGDAAGLQLSLKQQGPWVSNLDLAKGVTKIGKVAAPATKALPTANHVRQDLVDGVLPGGGGSGRRDHRHARLPFSYKSNKQCSKRALVLQRKRRRFKPNIPEKPLTKRTSQHHKKEKKFDKNFRVRRKRRATLKKKWKARVKDPKVKNQEEDNDLDEYPELEYLIWSSMPAVRRRLNNLEMDMDFDKSSSRNPRRKKFLEEKEKKADSV